MSSGTDEMSCVTRDDEPKGCALFVLPRESCRRLGEEQGSEGPLHRRFATPRILSSQSHLEIASRARSPREKIWMHSPARLHRRCENEIGAALHALI